MQKWIVLCLSFGLVVLAGCGETPDTSDAVDVPEPALEETAPLAPDATGAHEGPLSETPADEEPVAAVEPVEQPAASAGLVGSTWQVGEFTVTFKDDSRLQVMGGKAAEIAPQGLEGTYVVKDGVIEIRVLTEHKTGTWDGTQLVIDGVSARKQA